MRKDEYIDAVVGQEQMPKGRAGNLTLRMSNEGGLSTPSLRRQLYFYEACLWGALFDWDKHPVGALSETRPKFEFVNVGKYSVSTSSNQRKVFSAVDSAPRRYTPCLVIVPNDTGGKHWNPGNDWVTPMQVALDWCMENGRRSDFRGPPAQWGDTEQGRQLARHFNADAFWLLETATRTP